MTTAYVAYDVRSGRITSVHHGAADAEHARQSAHRQTKIADEHVAVISVPSESFERRKQYKVDVSHKVLVAATTGEGGVGGGFGAAGRSSKSD